MEVCTRTTSSRRAQRRIVRIHRVLMDPSSFIPSLVLDLSASRGDRIRTERSDVANLTILKTEATERQTPSKAPSTSPRFPLQLLRPASTRWSLSTATFSPPVPLSRSVLLDDRKSDSLFNLRRLSDPTNRIGDCRKLLIRLGMLHAWVCSTIVSPMLFQTREKGVSARDSYSGTMEEELTSIGTGVGSADLAGDRTVYGASACDPSPIDASSVCGKHSSLKSGRGLTLPHRILARPDVS